MSEAINFPLLTYNHFHSLFFTLKVESQRISLSYFFLFVDKMEELRLCDYFFGQLCENEKKNQNKAKSFLRIISKSGLKSLFCLLVPKNVKCVFFIVLSLHNLVKIIKSLTNWNLFCVRHFWTEIL